MDSLSLPYILPLTHSPAHVHVLQHRQSAILNEFVSMMRRCTPPKIQAGTVEAKSSPPSLARQEMEAKWSMQGFENYIDYLATGKLDVYLDSIKREDKVTDLDLGVVLPLHPILLIHELGKHADQERIEELFKCDRIDICDTVHLFNVSGSGKTRLSLDGLCSHWGLYISCRTRGTASGSDDLQQAMEMLQTMSTPDLSNNTSPAQRILAMLLCARFFIFKQLVQHFPVNTKVTDGGDGDLFVRVFQGLRDAETHIMLDIIRSSLRDIRTGRKDLFPMESKTPLFVVIDDTQVFRSESGTGWRREMVDFFESKGFFNGIILSGTGLLMEKVKDAVGSLSAKEAPSNKIFTNVGRFTSDDSSHKTYII
ncbi:hypothetical protein F5887DRAFT_1204973 [Amanita rubescens]|nr:hypothetical protein F5887DRAFT_1204973 [Amanita rubescens]